MKTIAKTLLTAIVVVLTAISIQAQPGTEHRFEGSDSARFAKKLDRMEKKLGLTADQKAKIKAIHAKHMLTVDQKKKDQEVKMKAFREEMEKERDKMFNEVKAVLTDAQKAKFDTIMTKMNEKKEHKMKEDKGPRHNKRCCCCCEKK